MARNGMKQLKTEVAELCCGFLTDALLLHGTELRPVAQEAYEALRGALGGFLKAAERQWRCSERLVTLLLYGDWEQVGRC